MIQQLLIAQGASSGAPVDPIVGQTFTVNQSGSTATLSVPVGAASGDLLLAVLRCRGDRTFTVPAGWTTVYSLLAPEGVTTDAGMRTYILSKAWESETSVSFTHSVSAAYSAALLLCRGSIGATATAAAGAGVTLSTTSFGSTAIALTLDNAYNTLGGSSGSRVSGYTAIFYSYFLSASLDYFGILADKNVGAPLGGNAISASFPSTVGTYRLLVALEIIPAP